MPLYKCVVKDNTGSQHTLQKNAKDEQELKQAIVNEGFWFVSCDTVNKKNRKKLKGKDINLIFSSLALTLDSGLSISESFKILSLTSSDKKISHFSNEIRQGLTNGYSLNTSVLESSYIFPDFIMAFLEIGEKTGSLKNIAPDIAGFTEEREDTRKQIINTSLYPLFLLIVLVIGIILLAFFLIPQIIDNFSDVPGFQLDLIMGRLEIIRVTVISLLSVSLLIFLGSTVFTRLFSSFKILMSSVLLAIPALGKLVLEENLFFWLWGMEKLLTFSVPIKESLDIAVILVSNTALKKDLEKVSTLFYNGKSLSDSISSSKYFTDEIKHWIMLGENIGEPENVFSQLRNYYSKKREQRMKLISNMTEPVFIVIIGIIIFSVAVTIVLPLMTQLGAGL